MIYGCKMQQKICPLCNETYQTFIDFCFRDGSKLGIEGQELDIEDTEYLTHTHKVSHNVPGSDSEDKTTPIDMTRSDSSDFEKGEVFDEDLSAPVVIGNTQMFRKEDLLAMFEDDSTYNGELIDPDETTSPYDKDNDTEDMEATETFDLSNPNASVDKTEFEESISSSPLEKNIETLSSRPPTFEQNQEGMSSHSFSAPKLAPTKDLPESETSFSSLFLLGGILGVFVAIAIFVFFYKAQEQKMEPTVTVVPNIPQKEAPQVPVSQPEPEPEAQPEDRPKEEQEAQPEPLPTEEIEEMKNVEASQDLEVQVFLNNQTVDMLLTVPISEEQLLTKLREYGYSDTVEGQKSLPFTINGDMKVIQFTIPASADKMISFDKGE